MSNREIRNFFPATAPEFEKKCGAVECLHESDFEDEYRRRHLLSFQESWNQWEAFDAKKRTFVDDNLLTFAKRLLDLSPCSIEELNSCLSRLRQETKIAPSKSHLFAAYQQCIKIFCLPRNPIIEKFLIKKIVRTHSGVLVITVLTSPGSFSCPQDCHYCPNEPGQPRSYLSTEPAVLRANQNGWDPAAQFWDRAITLYNNGHTVDKIEVLVLGGTWSGYPKYYQEEFIRDLFYAANLFDSACHQTYKAPRNVVSAAMTRHKAGEGLRKRFTLTEEQTINRTASCRIIGVTLETRPDHINSAELKRLRQFGCTRVQIGIQHIDDNILAKVNRGCYLRHAIRAIRLLKDACFKVDIHLMPDLPGSSPELDKKMFEEILSSVALQADQWKIYPCEITPFSRIEQWYKQKQFVPYAEFLGGYSLVQLLLKVKVAVHPWIRLNRIVRDIPNPSIIAGNDKTNLRQMLQDFMKKKKIRCRCLRCREVKTTQFDLSDIVMKVRQYPSFGGLDFFLSFETEDEAKLFAFLRLRIRASFPTFIKEDVLLQQIALDDAASDGTYALSQAFPELEQCGLIRELHVYGLLVGSKEKKDADDARPQHSGLGKKLLLAAEIITLSYGLKKMAVIAGVGTTEYYRKFGYEIENNFMTKKVTESSTVQWAKQLQLELPLTIQVYSLKTQLGHLSTKPQEDDPFRKNALVYSNNTILQKTSGDVYVEYSHPISSRSIDPCHTSSVFFKFMRHPILSLILSKKNVFSAFILIPVWSLTLIWLGQKKQLKNFITKTLVNMLHKS